MHETNPDLVNRLQARPAKGQIIHPEPSPLHKRLGPGVKPAPIRRQEPQPAGPAEVARILRGQPMTARPRDERRGASIMSGFDFGIPARVAVTSEVVAALVNTDLIIEPPCASGRVLLVSWEVFARHSATWDAPRIGVGLIFDRDRQYIAGESLPTVNVDEIRTREWHIQVIRPDTQLVGFPGASCTLRVGVFDNEQVITQMATYRLAEL